MEAAEAIVCLFNLIIKEAEGVNTFTEAEGKLNALNFKSLKKNGYIKILGSYKKFKVLEKAIPISESILLNSSPLDLYFKVLQQKITFTEKGEHLNELDTLAKSMWCINNPGRADEWNQPLDEDAKKFADTFDSKEEREHLSRHLLILIEIYKDYKNSLIMTGYPYMKIMKKTESQYPTAIFLKELGLLQFIDAPETDMVTMSLSRAGYEFGEAFVGENDNTEIRLLLNEAIFVKKRTVVQEALLDKAISIFKKTAETLVPFD
ncbi:MAG: hypothetical protein PF542_05540 [Nanoarchaeota archaeon]|nr:hypothetical protein [Nanoarchaeota archaeon]